MVKQGIHAKCCKNSDSSKCLCGSRESKIIIKKTNKQSHNVVCVKSNYNIIVQSNVNDFIEKLNFVTVKGTVL